MTNYAIVLHENGFGALVVEQTNRAGAELPVYVRVAAFESRVDAQKFIELKKKEQP